MKTTVVEYWKSKAEISAMDDELPIVIYIMAMTTADTMVAEAMFMLDYVGNLSRFENEARMLVNIETSIRFIAQELEVDLS
jgi:hypothetical protein